MAIYEFEGTWPRVDSSAWLAASAQVIGNVVLAPQVSVWFGAVIRGDQSEPITIGQATNIQDGCILHADAGMPLTIGERVTVGHRAVLHGCTIGNESLVGLGALVLNGAVVGSRCLIGAGALVTEGKQFPDGSLIVGSPAVVKRPLSGDEMAALAASASHYVTNAQRFQATLRRRD